jgi:membrane protease YdiL (CAAX protease family)
MNEPSEPQSPIPLDSSSLDPEPAAEPVPDTPHVESVEHVDPPGPSSVRLWMMCAGGFLAFGAFYIFMFVAGGEFRQFAAAGLEACPFAILAVMAYASNPKGFGGKALTLAYWIILVGAVGIASLAMTAVGVLQIKVGGDPRAVPPPTIDQILRILAAGLALAAAGGIGLFCFSSWVRKRAATRIDLDPQSFVHATGLATTVTMTLMCTIPLLAVHHPLTEWLFDPKSGLNLTGSELTVSSVLYGLLWAVPASFVAVGFPIKRTLREAQQRLALVWPNRRQVVMAIAIALGLALAAGPVHFLIGLLWNALGLPMTDTHAVEALFKNAISPAGAVVVGISAGLGEELVFRGVLLPRMGVVLTALLFTALHAFQYNFDALIWILILGIVLGYARKKTNTTTCVLIHGTYDLTLLLAAYFFGS